MTLPAYWRDAVVVARRREYKPPPLPYQYQSLLLIKESARRPRRRAVVVGPKNAPRLVDLHSPLALLLEVGDEVVVRLALLPADLLEHVLDAGHHALEAAEVHDGAVLEALEDLVGVLLHLCENSSWGSPT